MKKYIFIIISILFLGCSNKVYVPIVKTPNEIKNQKIDSLEIKLKNDNINLSQNLLNQMYQVNNIVPNYFKFNEKNYILQGEIKTTISNHFYTKKVKLHQNPPICEYKFYKCKAVNGLTLCNYNKVALKFDEKQYKKIKPQIFTNKEFVLYKNNLYKIKKNCKPTSTTIKCEKTSIQIDTFIKIKNLKNKTIFSKNYFISQTKDPCKNIYYYQGQKIYKNKPIKFYIQQLSQQLAQNIISDIAPHQEYFVANLYDELDIETTPQNKKIFENIINNTNLDYLDIRYLKELEKLHKKYPKSCVISYDLSLYLIANNQYQKAKSLLTTILNSKCDEEIKQSSSQVLYNLIDVY